MYSQVWSENYRMNIDHSPVFLESRMGTNLITSIYFLEDFHRFWSFHWLDVLLKITKT